MRATDVRLKDHLGCYLQFLQHNCTGKQWFARTSRLSVFSLLLHIYHITGYEFVWSAHVCISKVSSNQSLFLGDREKDQLSYWRLNCFLKTRCPIFKGLEVWLHTCSAVALVFLLFFDPSLFSNVDFVFFFCCHDNPIY